MTDRCEIFKNCRTTIPLDSIYVIYLGNKSLIIQPCLLIVQALRHKETL